MWKRRGYWQVAVAGADRHRSWHRVWFEFNLGRLLCDDECLHHLDGNRDNNEVGNLVIVSASEHTRLHMKLRAIK